MIYLYDLCEFTKALVTGVESGMVERKDAKERFIEALKATDDRFDSAVSLNILAATLVDAGAAGLVDMSLAKEYFTKAVDDFCGTWVNYEVEP